MRLHRSADDVRTGMRRRCTAAGGGQLLALITPCIRAAARLLPVEAIHTWNGRDALVEVVRFEKLVHNVVGAVLVAVPNLQDTQICRINRLLKNNEDSDMQCPQVF